MGHPRYVFATLVIATQFVGCHSGPAHLTDAGSIERPFPGAASIEVAQRSMAEPLPAPPGWAEEGLTAQKLTLRSGGGRFAVSHAIGSGTLNRARLVSSSKMTNQPISIDDRIQFHKALALADSGRLDESLSQLTELIGPTEACCQLGILCYDRGDLDSSRLYLQQARQSDPESSEALVWDRWVQIQSETVTR